MIFYCIRLIIIAIISIILFIILKHFNVSITKSQECNNNRRKVLCILFAVLMIVITFIPFEGKWLRFETPEESIKYSLISINKKNYFIYDDDTVFVMRNKDNNFEYHSITKYNENYGMCDYDSKSRQLKSQFISTENYNGLLSYKCIYNQATNKLCCFFNYTPINNDIKVKILDDKNREIPEINGFNKENTYAYYLILENPQQNELSISIDNKNYVIKLD